MRKLFILLAAVALSASAASAQGWGIGGRAGDGLQGVGQRYFANNNYLEARLGFNYLYEGGLVADFSTLYYWNIMNWDWTPGNWFLDIGGGVNIGGKSKYLFFGAQASGKFGYTFENVPWTISADYSPSFGPEIGWWKSSSYTVIVEPVPGSGGGGKEPMTIPGGSKTRFNYRGLYNFGISAVYRF